MNSSHLRVVYSADDDYALPLAAAVRSLLDNCDSKTSIDLLVLSSGISEDNQRKLEQSWGSKHLHSLEFIEVDKERLGQLPRQSLSNQNLMRAVYARLMISSAAPSDWERIIYLDSDTVVRTDLTDLFSWDLAGMAVAARPDPIITTLGHPGGVQCYREIGASPSAPYFNSGVLVMDLEYWRECNLPSKILSFVSTHGAKMNLRDQEGLNAVLQGKFSPIPWEWNTITLIGRDKVPRPSGTDIAEQSKILHYVGPLKPWMPGGSQIPGSAYFFESLERTAWRGELG